MSALPDVVHGVVYAAMDFDAPPERVFRALTDPAELAAWWGADDAYRSFDWQVDLRVGDTYRSRQRSATDPTAPETTVEGEYLVIDPPRLLVCTWRPSWEDVPETTIRYELTPTAAGGTRLVLTHTGFAGRAGACEDHARGWTAVLGWLHAYSERAESEPPPRAALPHPA